MAPQELKVLKKPYQSASEAMIKQLIMQGKLLDLEDGNPRYISYKNSMGWNSSYIIFDLENGLGRIELQPVQQGSPEVNKVYALLEIPEQTPESSRVLKGIQDILAEEGFK